MEKEIGYKIFLNIGGCLYSLRYLSQLGVIHYKFGVVNKPMEHCGPLTVYTDLKRAENHWLIEVSTHNKAYSYFKEGIPRNVKPELYKVEYKPSSFDKVWVTHPDGEKQFGYSFQYLRNIARVVDTADEVVLIERIK